MLFRSPSLYAPDRDTEETEPNAELLRPPRTACARHCSPLICPRRARHDEQNRQEMEELQQLLTPLASPRPVHATLAHAPHSILNTLRPTLRPQHPIRTNRKLTLILLPVLGSSTLLTSLVNAATVPPTVPLLTTNDLGTLGALGSTEESVGLTCRGELARFFPPARGESLRGCGSSSCAILSWAYWALSPGSR